MKLKLLNNGGERYSVVVNLAPSWKKPFYSLLGNVAVGAYLDRSLRSGRPESPAWSGNFESFRPSSGQTPDRASAANTNSSK